MGAEHHVFAKYSGVRSLLYVALHGFFVVLFSACACLSRWRGLQDKLLHLVRRVP